MMKTFALRDREQPLVIAGPRGLSALMTGFAPVIGRLTYEVEVRELEPGEAIECDGYRVEPFATRHGAPSLGYALCEERRPGPVRPGRRPRGRACPTGRCSGGCRRASG